MTSLSKVQSTLLTKSARFLSPYNHAQRVLENALTLALAIQRANGARELFALRLHNKTKDIFKNNPPGLLS